MLNPTTELLRPEIGEMIAAGEYRELRESLRVLDPADVADLIDDLLEELGPDEAAVAFRVLPRAEMADTFAHLDQEEQEQLIAHLGDERAVRVVESLEPDDRARLLDELPLEVTQRILRSLDPKSRRETQAILGYPAESVGRLMTPDYVKVGVTFTAAQSLEHIRRYGQDAETVHWVYVVDADGRLVDDLHIRKILLADPEQTIDDIRDRRYLALEATDDREEAVRVMNRYDRTALPVVDSLGLLVGIVTIDDVADVAEIEATEDIHKLGGMETLKGPYLSTRFLEALRKRGGWLAGLFVLQLATIAVMGIFDEQLSKAAFLAVFVPLIISSGGNTGTQAASMLVRALALEEVTPGDWVRVVWLELKTGLVLGSVLGVLGVLAVMLAEVVGLVSIDGTTAITVGIVVGTAVVGIVIWGTLAGSLLPLVLQRLNLDPATSSSPLVATIMDVSGLTIYFAVALVVLNELFKQAPPVV
ncbi:MAG: magnesium transporter [Planctomycetota bacterium]